MNFQHLWQQTRSTIFITLAVSFVLLDTWLIDSQQYLVTMYILIVTILIVFIQKRYQETPRSLSVPDLQFLAPQNNVATLNLAEMLLREFDYAKETAAQAMNDRGSMVKYLLLTAGVVMVGATVMISGQGGVRFSYRYEVIIALCLVFTTIGWVYFIQVVRLRQAWCESARAMNHIKQVFVKHGEYPPEEAKAAFRWNIYAIPSAAKKMTVFYFSALLIGILSATAIGLASTILLGVDQVSRFYFIPMGLSFYHLHFQMSMYSALLEERVLSKADDMYRAFQKSQNAPVETEKLRVQFEASVEREELLGLKRRLSFGNFILEQPELLEFYSSAIIDAAKHDPNGMGSIAEDDVLAGRFSIPKKKRIPDREKEKPYLIEAMQELVNSEVALREPADDGYHLIFPSQFTREHPDLPEPEGKAVIFTFKGKGSMLDIYATLAVRLSHSGLFKKKEIWKNAVTYTTMLGGKCGILLRELSDGRGELTLFFDAEASEETRFHFEEYVHTHLQRRALRESIYRQRIFVCPKCGTPVTELQADRRRKRDFNWIECNVCNERVSLLDRQERITGERSSRVSEIDRAADARRELEKVASILQGKIATGDFDVFLAHNNQDKSQVESIADKLKQRGLYPWFDKEQIPPGRWFQDVIQQAIPKVKSAAIFIGPKGLGKWEELELQSFISQCVEVGKPVIPVLLPGVDGIPENLFFLKQLSWVRFAKNIDDPEALDNLQWGIEGKRPQRL